MFSGYGGEITNHGDGTATYSNWLEGDSGGSGGGYSVGTGWDSFTYGIIDSTGKTATGHVDMYIIPNNPNYDNWPIARPDYATTLEDTPVIIDLLSNDWDHEGPVTLVGVWVGVPGAIVVDNLDGTVTYTPAPNFHGTDYISYQIQDSAGQTASYSGQSGGGNIKILPVNDPPEANDDSDNGMPFVVWSGSGIVIDVLYNDTDVEVAAEEQSFIITDVTQGAKGKVIFNGSNVTYIANQGESGLDSFTYTVKDGHGGSDTANVNVEIKSIDLDIDSDNNNGFNDPDRNDAEDCIENDADKVGKRIIANWSDKDADGVIDYLDGYNRDGIPGNSDDVNLQEKFVPLILEISDNVDLSEARISISYSAAGLGIVPTGGLRIWKLDQPEDARSRTTDDYLAPGTYSASDLGLGGTPSLSKLYVEGIIPSTAVGNYQITVSIDPDGDGPAGFVASDTVRVTVVTVEILDSQEIPTNELKVAKWQDAYEEIDFLMHVKDNFIDLDPDRFYVRVRDVSMNMDPNTKDKVTITLATDSPGTDYDDTPTEIELEETGVNTGVFISKSLMLMGDVVDDAHSVDSMDNVIADNAKNDRTHIIALDGQVQIRYPDFGTEVLATATVPLEKTLTIPTIYILRDKAESEGGKPVLDDNEAVAIAKAEADVKWANERYAQAGIKIEVGQILIVDPPNGVNLADGSLDASYKDANFDMHLSDEQKALFDALGTANTSDIIVFYVNRLSDNALGEAVYPKEYPNEADKRLNNFIIAAQGGANHGTFSHELLHILIDDSHIFAADQQYIWYPGEAPDNDIEFKRRLTPDEADKARNSQFVQ